MMFANRRSPTGLGLTTFIAVALLAGCSEEDPGDPNVVAPGGSQAASATASPTDDANNDAAPSVADPLDVSGLQQDICSALSSAQVDEFNLTPGKRDSMDAGAPVCDYEYKDDSSSSLKVTLNTDLANGLDDIYAQQGDLGYFEPTEVSGYPGVYASSGEDRRDVGRRQLLVGLTDQDVVSMWVYLTDNVSDYPRGCEVAEFIAETVIENLKGGA